MKTKYIALALLLLLMGCASLKKEKNAHEKEQFIYKADKISFQQDGFLLQGFILKGNAFFQYHDRYITADKIFLTPSDGSIKLEATGNPKLFNQDGSLVEEGEKVILLLPDFIRGELGVRKGGKLKIKKR
jgi:lipopolysaccharide assembly outer membrane protein LptD (OstA)